MYVRVCDSHPSTAPPCRHLTPTSNNNYTTAPRVQSMLEALKGLGCELDLDTVVDCRRCNIAATGGFIPNVQGLKEGEYKPKVVVCEDNLLGPHYVAQTLAHELVHAYDQCRAKINWRSCYHYACTEVRGPHWLWCAWTDAHGFSLYLDNVVVVSCCCSC